jgi:glycosylphosphatidylinositol transamidase (GPIT) subunit GPI8
MTDFQKIPVSYGGHDFVSEFNAETVKGCVSAGALSMTEKPLDFAFECFFWSIQKNHPFTTRKKAKEFFDSIVDDEDYGPNAFSEITDEFAEKVKELFTSTDRKGKKKRTFKALPSPEIKVPKI